MQTDMFKNVAISAKKHRFALKVFNSRSTAVFIRKIAFKLKLYRKFLKLFQLFCLQSELFWALNLYEIDLFSNTPGNKLEPKFRTVFTLNFIRNNYDLEKM